MMSSFKAAPVTLSQALELAAKIVERRSTIPILECVRLIVKEGSCTLYATDLDTMLCAQFETSLPDMDRAVDCGQFVNAVRKMDAPTLTYEKETLIVGNGTTVCIPTKSAETFPMMAEALDEPVCFSLPSAQLAADIAAVSPGIGREETRYYLMGILMHSAEGRLRFATTDGHRLHRIDRELPEGADGLGDSIVPRTACRLLRGALEDAQAQDTALRFWQKRAAFTIGSVTITTKLIDGTFPDYKRVIPTADEHAVTVDPQAIIGPSRLIQSLLGDMKQYVAIRPAENEIAGKSDDGLKITAKLGAKVDGKPAEIGFRAQYLADAICAFGDAGYVRLSYADQASPALLTVEGSPMLAVLMPVRL